MTLKGYYALNCIILIYSSSFVEIDSKKRKTNKQTNIYKQNTKIAMKSTEILTLRNYMANISNFNDDYLALLCISY